MASALPPQQASVHSPSAHPHSLHKEPCHPCGHSSEESDTSGASEASTLQRLVIPSPPPGSSSTLPGGSCWAGGQSSNRSVSVHSFKTAVLEAAAAGGSACSQAHPSLLQQRAVTPAALTAALININAAAAAAAAGTIPSPPLAGSSVQNSRKAHHTGTGQQHSSHPWQQQQHQQHDFVKQGHLNGAGNGSSAPYDQLQLPGGHHRQQQQHRQQMPGLPPLPSTSRHYQHRPQPVLLPDHQQRHAQQQQQQQGAGSLGMCWACSSGQPGGCGRCRQEVRVSQVLQAAAPQAHQHHHHHHHQQHYYQQQQQLALGPSWFGASAGGVQPWQHPTAGPVAAQPTHQQLLLQHHRLQEQLSMLAQQQQQQQQQQVCSAPGAGRPWGWWHQRGTQHNNILQCLDAVRPPLLHLHTAVGDTSSASLLQAMCGSATSSSNSSPGEQQMGGAAAGPGVGPDIVRAWQHLLAVETQRQQLVSLHCIQQQLLQHAQQQGQQVEASRAADAAAGSSAAAAAAAAAAAGKPPKHPRQPKMAPDEHNWSEAAFAQVQASCYPGSVVPPGGKDSTWPNTLPEHSSCTFAQLMLLHGAGWPNHLLWEHWQAAHPTGSLALFVHMKSGVALTPGMPGCDVISRTKLSTSLDACWGDISLVEATLASCEEILQRCPHVTHIGLASGHDVPVQLIRPGLLLPGVSMFGLYQFGAPEMVTLKEAVVEELLENSAMTNSEAHVWGNALTFHHQWMVLSREHAAALVQHRREIMMVGRLLHKACCSVRAGMAPDEFIVVTALKQMGYVRSVQRVEVKPHMRYPPGCLLNSYPTFVVFPAESSPHPVLWTQLEKKVRCQVENEAGQQYHTMLSLNDCLDLAVERCAIFFRKIEVSQPWGEDMLALLSTLVSMWLGQRKGSTAALKTSSGSSTGVATGSKRRGKRKQGGSNGATPQTSGDAGVSPDLSAAADMAISSAPPEEQQQQQQQAAASVEPLAASCKRRRELLAIAYGLTD